MSGPITFEELEAATAKIEQARIDRHEVERRAEVAEADVRAARAAFEDASLALANGAADARATFERAQLDIVAAEASLETFARRLIPAANTALQQSEEDYASLCRRASYDAAEELAAKARSRLMEEYPAVCAQLRDLLANVAAAGAAVRAVNCNLPSGAIKLSDPESDVRDQAPRCKTLLGEEQIERWIYADNDAFVPPADVSRIERKGDRTGILRSTGLTQSFRTVELRPCILSIFSPERDGRVGPRLAEMDIPGLTAVDAHVWKAQRFALPSDVLAQLAECPGSTGRLERTVTEVRLA